MGVGKQGHGVQGEEQRHFYTNAVSKLVSSCWKTYITVLFYFSLWKVCKTWEGITSHVLSLNLCSLISKINYIQFRDTSLQIWRFCVILKSKGILREVHSYSVKEQQELDVISLSRANARLVLTLESKVEKKSMNGVLPLKPNLFLSRFSLFI